MKEVVEKVVKALVADTDAVEVFENADGGKNIRIVVRVGKDDFGRVIGREGRTIKALRSLLFIAGQKNGKRYHLDLLED
ncbi:MAG TPA: hypothetical protein DEA22_11850 [Blastocatellia bacterium]|nr:hypothetical protein [Blastocatellia bacterium]